MGAWLRHRFRNKKRQAASRKHAHENSFVVDVSLESLESLESLVRWESLGSLERLESLVSLEILESLKIQAKQKAGRLKQKTQNSKREGGGFAKRPQ